MPRKTLGKQIRVQVLARDNYKCKMCGRTKDDIPLEVDHIIPVNDGGTDELNNLATLCRDCNRGKSDYKFPDYSSIIIVPEDIENHFYFFRDVKRGDFEQYNFYLYFKEGIHSGGADKNFNHTWRISGTVYDTSSNREALEERRKKEEIPKFITAIKKQLISEGKRLIYTEEGLCKI